MLTPAEMQHSRRFQRPIIASMTRLLLVPLAAPAQFWPTQPVRVMVGFPLSNFVICTV